jgi:ribosomal-protein-alanine N-acetyltransferase
VARVAVDVTCRPLTEEDVPAVMRIELASFAQPWSEALFVEELAEPSRRYVAADASGNLCGYGGMMVVGEEATVLTVAVAPGRREHGIASLLLLELVGLAQRAGARHLTLEVRESNRPALDLYAKFGFRPAGFRKGYYGTEDAVIMWAVDIDSLAYQDRLAAIREEAS